MIYDTLNSSVSEILTISRLHQRQSEVISTGQLSLSETESIGSWTTEDPRNYLWIEVNGTLLLDKCLRRMPNELLVTWSGQVQAKNATLYRVL